MATPFINAPVSTTPAPLLWRPPVNTPMPLVPGVTPTPLMTYPVPVGYVPRLRTITPPLSSTANQTVSPGGDVLSLSRPPAEGASGANSVPASEATPHPAPDPSAPAEAVEPVAGHSATQEGISEAARATEPAEPAKPLTRGQQIGQKVGQFLDDNPKVLAEVEKLDPDRLMDDPNSLANEIKGQFQRSKVFRLLQRVGLDRRIAGLFPAEMEPTVLKVFKWLETPVEGGALMGDPLAEAAPEKKKGRFSRKRETSGSADLGSLAAAAV